MKKILGLVVCLILTAFTMATAQSLPIGNVLSDVASNRAQYLAAKSVVDSNVPSEQKPFEMMLASRSRLINALMNLQYAVPKKVYVQKVKELLDYNRSVVIPGEPYYAKDSRIASYERMYQDAVNAYEDNAISYLDIRGCEDIYADVFGQYILRTTYVNVGGMKVQIITNSRE